MIEVEKEGIGKTKVGLIVCAVLVVILAISSVWFYTRIITLETDKSALEIKVTNLQSEIDTLESQVTDLETNQTNLQSQVSSLQTEKSQLASQVTSLQTQVSSLQNEINSLNSEYDNYVATHNYSDSEYDEVQFFFYYIIPPEQKFGVYNLSDGLYGLEWIEPYQEDVFDCSEMSAYLEWYLENEGWNVIIILGDAPFGGGYHAWLLVETSTDHYMPVESTTIEIVWWDDPYFDNYFIYDYEFETIQEAIAYDENEFDWWK